MRVEEAEWISRVLTAQPAGQISPLLELGSSTADFREIIQPHIAAHLDRPLSALGVKIVHVDAKAAPGVDISGDIYDPATQGQIKRVRARAILCCNLFEHVVDRRRLATICDQCLEPGGLMVVSVPYSYPYHLDPIDTGYRPTPQEIVELFPNYFLVDAEIVKSSTYWQELRNFGALLLALARLCILWRGWKSWKARADRFRWLFRRYSVSIAVMRKPLSAG